MHTELDHLHDYLMHYELMQPKADAKDQHSKLVVFFDQTALPRDPGDLSVLQNSQNAIIADLKNKTDLTFTSDVPNGPRLIVSHSGSAEEHVKASMILDKVLAEQKEMLAGVGDAAPASRENTAVSPVRAAQRSAPWLR